MKDSTERATSRGFAAHYTPVADKRPPSPPTQIWGEGHLYERGLLREDALLIPGAPDVIRDVDK